MKHSGISRAIGKNTIGSGKKMRVELHAYERSTHDLGYLWRSSMSSGTLVPFIKQLALPGDSFDIDLNCVAMTHPTIGPLFGSFKIQLDVFQAPIRLYQSALHNNMLKVGMNMSQILLPTYELSVDDTTNTNPDVSNSQINPSSILSYLGNRGVGWVTGDGSATREFLAIPLLAYWEIYKNYYANKQEEVGYVIDGGSIAETITGMAIGANTIDQAPAITTPPVTLTPSDQIIITYAVTPPDPSTILFSTLEEGEIPGNQIVGGWHDNGTDTLTSTTGSQYGTLNIINWTYADVNNNITLTQFDLDNIDVMRQDILASPPLDRYLITNAFNAPYSTPLNTPLSSQVGLGIKTYQSDLLNNWITTDFLDQVTTASNIDVSGGTLSIDSLVLARKIYDLLNRVAVSGGSYDDWLDVVYTTDRYTRCESPIYHGGLSKELVFQQVISNAEAGQQPLGTLAGRGQINQKHKGGKVIIKVDEPSYIIGIVSLTPRIDYSQGNDADIYSIKTMDDLHKPGLDEIGFQDLITEQMAWWDTHWSGTAWAQNSAGKQPAWINYMTNINKTFGNFAIASNEMFMTLNRRYTPGETVNIEDLTTYIDPAKYNYIFAQTSLDAQNFWTQISVDMIVRRKMSAKIMPNL